MLATTPCPDRIELQRLLLGQSPEDCVNVLEAHVSDCPTCGERLAELSTADGLVDVLRDVPAALARLPRGDRVDDLLRRVRQINVRSLSMDSEADAAPDGVAESAESQHGIDVASVLDPPQQPDELGRLGAWRVLRPLGRGGMGVVFLAEDARLNRLAALKLILDVRFVDPHFSARFEREGQSLARLRHPNIVQIYEVGKHRGRPFLALEYVAGITLAQHLAGTPQPVRLAAELMRTLAEAVHYAHEQGVVHRDLKPANVLLEDGRGLRVERRGPEGKTHDSDWSGSRHSSLDSRPVITDFGLAKRLDETGLTQTGDLLGTPGYMAPELTRGGIIGAESGRLVDVYSLGCILYELLTGRPPFRGATVLETLDQARSLEPIAPRRLQPKLPREIETICLKCLEKSPHRRYESAQELADDLRRFLDGEPIHARPVSVLERLLKWARRKPAAAALVAVSIVAMAVLAGGSIVHQRQLQHALGKANENAEQAQREQRRADANYAQARDTISKMLAALEARQFGDIPKLKELQQKQLEGALAFYLAIAEQSGDAAEVRYDTARAALEAGRIQHQLGQSDAAMANFEQARDAFAALADENPAEPRYRAGLATSLTNLARRFHNSGRFDEALALDQQAFEIREELLRSDPESREFRDALAGSYHMIGTVHYNATRLNDAEPYFHKANTLRSGLVAQYPDSRELRMSLAQTQLSLSILFQLTKRYDEMREFHDLAETNLTLLVRDDPNDHAAIHSLVQLRVNWAYVQQREGNAEAALAELERNIELVEPALRREPNAETLRDAIFRSHGLRAQFLDQLGRYYESAESWQACVECSPPAVRTVHRLFLVMARVRAGRYEQGAAEAESIAAELRADADPEWLEHLAQVLSLASARARDDRDRAEPERSELAERYAAEAIGLLGRLRAAEGDEKWKRRAANRMNNKELESLRTRDAFRKLMGDIRNNGPKP